MTAKIVALILYALILIALGVLASRRMKDMRDFYAGGKKMNFLSVAFSSRATGESAWLLLGLTGFGAAYGLKGLWIVAGELLGVGLAWLWMSRRFKLLTDRYDSITIPDYLESRFRDSGHWLRLIAAGSLCIFVAIYVAAQIHATGQAAENFLHADYFLGAILGFGVVMLYITFGGFVAVVWSDIFQGSLMGLGLVILPIVALWVGGGPSEVIATLRNTYPDHLSLTAGEAITPFTIVGIVGLMAIGIGFLGSPQVFVRFIALRSETEIRRGAAVALTWTILADTGAVLTGFFGRAVLEGSLGPGSESVLPDLVNNYLPAFVAGIYIAVVLAAIMSTADSLLVVASSAGVRDFYQKVLHPEMSDKQLVRLSRVMTFTLAGVALAIAMSLALWTPLRSEGLFWFIIFGWSGIAATFCPTIILSLFWSKMTAMGAKCGMVAGFLAIPFFKFFVTGVGEPAEARLAEAAAQEVRAQARADDQITQESQDAYFDAAWAEAVSLGATTEDMNAIAISIIDTIAATGPTAHTEDAVRKAAISTAEGQGLEDEAATQAATIAIGSMTDIGVTPEAMHAAITKAIEAAEASGYEVGPIARGALSGGSEAGMAPQAVDAAATAAATAVDNSIKTFGEHIDTLDVLAPAFLVSGFVIVVVSLADKKGQAKVAEAKDDLKWAGSRKGIDKG